MFGPRFAEVGRGADPSAGPAVVPHVQHQHARTHLCHLRLGSIGVSVVVHVPGLAMVLAVNDARIRNPVCPDVLYREYQCPVMHGDAASWALQRHIPFRLLDLRRDIHRLGPSLAVILAAADHQLRRLLRRHALFHAGPGPPAADSVRPNRNDEYFAGLLVHQHRRIPDAVLRLRKAAPFAQIHDHAHLLPSTAGVNASACANVNVALQILA